MMKMFMIMYGFFTIFSFYFRYPGGDCTSDIYLADMDAKVAKL